jgi:hypothetical protein
VASIRLSVDTGDQWLQWLQWLTADFHFIEGED